MRVILNIIWLVLAGLWLAIGYVFAGIIMCITIIGIPFGVQAFKLAVYALWPFGRTLVPSATRLKGLSVIPTSCGSSWPAGGWRSCLSSRACFCA